MIEWLINKLLFFNLFKGISEWAVRVSCRWNARWSQPQSSNRGPTAGPGTINGLGSTQTFCTWSWGQWQNRSGRSLLPRGNCSCYYLVRLFSRHFTFRSFRVFSWHIRYSRDVFGLQKILLVYLLLVYFYIVLIGKMKM